MKRPISLLLNSVLIDEIRCGSFAGVIGEYDPVRGVSKNFPVTTCTKQACTDVVGIAADQHEKIWFTDMGGGKVGYLNAQTGHYATKVIGNGQTAPYDGLVIDASGTIWFTQINNSLLTMWPGDNIPTK